jgi:hypothetical protein
MNLEVSLSTVTRLRDLLDEVRKGTDWFYARPINEYKDGLVRASGSYEWVCRHCGVASRTTSEFAHKDECLISRINVIFEPVNLYNNTLYRTASPAGGEGNAQTRG